MGKKEIIRRLGEYFDCELGENGEYDLTDYDWTAGCRFSPDGKWLSLSTVVEALTRDCDEDESEEE